MKYTASTYAKALAESLTAAKKEDHASMIKRFIALVVRHNDAKLLPKIAELAAKILREKEGGNKFTIESARPLPKSLKEKLEQGFQAERHMTEIEERIIPSLIAGVRIIKNEEEQMDFSFLRRLQRMFS